MAIAPKTYDFMIQRRSDHKFGISVKDGNNTAINLTGYTVTSQIWNESRTTKAADVSISITSASGGTLDWSVTDTQTTQLTDNEYRYDVLLTNPSGLKEYWLEGIIFMDEGYTA